LFGIQFFTFAIYVISFYCFSAYVLATVSISVSVIFSMWLVILLFKNKQYVLMSLLAIFVLLYLYFLFCGVINCSLEYGVWKDWKCRISSFDKIRHYSWCRRWGSNPHGIATTGFWVCKKCVYALDFEFV